MKLTKFFVMALMCASLFSCSKHYKDSKKFEDLLEAETGVNWKVQKLNTETGLYTVFKNKSTGEYVAYNMALFDRELGMTFDQYMAIAVDGTDIVRNLDRNSTWIDTSYWSTNTYYEGDWEWSDYYDDWVWCDSCGYSWTEDVWIEDGYTYYWYTGNGFSFSNDSTNVSHDLETLTGLAEQAKIGLMSAAIANEFQLSSKRATELAKLSVKYNKIENLRELSAEEKDYFSVSALGVNFTDLTNAYRQSQGDSGNTLNDLMKQAAEHNGTTSENLSKYVKEYLSSELD